VTPARVAALCIVLAAAGAFAFRLLPLDRRPMHGDEANQAVKTGILLDTGEYRYDPHDHHGPALYYFALVPAWLSGASTLEDLTERSLRIVPMLFGAGLVLLMVLLRDAMGRVEAVCAAILLAVLPAFVFYSDYYIQEMLLVFFTAAFLAFVWRYVRNPSWGWAIAAGASAALMQATKETAALAFAAAAIGAGVAFAVSRREREALPRPNTKHLAVAIGVAVAIWVTLYTSFFTHLRGPLDAVLAYGNYLQRADGAGLHDKPWYYYAALLAYTHRGPGPSWSDGLVLTLALVGLIVAIRGYTRDAQRATFLRFIAVYTIVLTAMYALIPYKTPWSLLSFYFGVVILAAIGAGFLIQVPKRVPLRIALATPFVACVVLGAFMAYRAVYVYPADPRNPYVYAHTSSAHLQMIERIHDIAAVHPQGTDMVVYVIQPDRDYWPLPWYLRDLNRVGYFDAIPDPPDADVIIVAPRVYPELAERLEHDYMGIVGGLRPSVLRTVLIRQEWWDAFMADRR
jgi:uncharacterized protein (TIGR03663 family)